MSALSFRHLCRLAFLVLLLFGAGGVPAFAACQTTTQVVPPGGSFTNTGCISTTGINAVSAGPGSTVNNAAGGTISLTASVLGTAGINATGDSNIITNAGDMTVTSGLPAGSAILAPGSMNTITNTGTITVVGAQYGISSGNLTTGSNTVTNNGTITLRTNGAGMIGQGDGDILTNNGSIVFASGGAIGGLFSSTPGSNTLVNNGSITDSASASSNTGIYCLFRCNATNSASGSVVLNGDTSTAMRISGSSTLTNNGSLTMNGTRSTAIFSDGFSNTINNNGPVSVSGANSFGLFIRDFNNTTLSPGTVTNITNSAAIVVTGAGSIGVNFATPNLTDDIILIIGQPFGASGNVFTNTGLLRGGPGAIAIGDTAEIHGRENARASNNTVINSGTIDGQVALSQGTNESLTNSGTMTISYPGAGITHSINGTFTQTSTGTIAFRIDPTGANDRLVVTGPANIAGTAQIIAQSGTYAANTQYTLLTATGGVNGRFSTLTTNMAFLRPVLSYDANDVFLTVLPTSPTPAGTPDYRLAAQTYNQLRVATGLTNAASLNPGGVGGVIVGALNNLLVGQAPGVFDALSGAGITATQNIAFDASKLVTSAMNDQGLFWREGGPDVNGITVGAPSFYASVKKGPFEVVPPPPPPPVRTWRAWFTGFGQGERINGELPLGTSRQDNTLFGGVGGLDYQLLPNALIGVAAGGSSGHFNVPNLATSGSVDGAHIGAYGVTTFGPFYAQSSSTFSVYGNHTARNIAGFGGLASEIDRGDFASRAWRSRFEIGDRFVWWDAAVTPFAAMEIAKLWSNAFTESGGILGLSVPASSHVSAPVFAGVRFEKAFVLSNGWVFTPNVSLAYVHEFSPVRDLFAGLTFLPASTFTVDGARPGRDAAQIKTGAKLALNPWAAVYANFEGEFSNRSQTYAGKGGLKVSW